MPTNGLNILPIKGPQIKVVQAIDRVTAIVHGQEQGIAIIAGFHPEEPLGVLGLFMEDDVFLFLGAQTVVVYLYTCITWGEEGSASVRRVNK